MKERQVLRILESGGKRLERVQAVFGALYRERMVIGVNILIHQTGKESEIIKVCPD